MRWANQEIRNLLRLMRRPHALERERLAVMLREATHAADARSALQHVIERAFDRSNPIDRVRFEIIARCDIGGETTRSAAAALHLSLRQFFRIRSDAIAAIAQSVERALRQPPDSHSDLMQLARTLEMIDPKAALAVYLRLPRGLSGETAYNIVRTSIWAGLDVTQEQLDACEGPWRLLAYAAVARNRVSRGDDAGAKELRDWLRLELGKSREPRNDEVAFELAFLDRCDAARRGNIAESREMLDRLRLFAGQDERLLALTLLSEADQASTEGDVTAASVALEDVERLAVRGHDVIVMARAALAKARVSFVRGYYEEAHALANGASLGMASLEAAVAWRAAGIAGRAALFCGANWSPPPVLVEKYPEVWTRSLAEGVRARHLLPADPEAARAAAEFAIALAARHDCPAYQAYAQVSLAAALEQLGQPKRAQELRTTAWSVAVRLNSKFMLHDLFFVPAARAHDVGSLRLDKAFVGEVLKFLEEAVPEYGGVRSRALGSHAQVIARHCLARGTGCPLANADIESIRKPMAEALRLGSGDVLLLRSQCDPIGRVAAHALAWCLRPEERAAFESRFIPAWNEGGEALAVAICPALGAMREAV